MVGHKIGVHADAETSEVFFGIVAYHKHICAFEPGRTKVLGIVGELGLDRRRVLVVGDARKRIRVDPRPGKAPLHGAQGKHGHGGQHERIALCGKRLDHARCSRIRHDALPDLPEIVLVEFVDERRPIDLAAIDDLEKGIPVRLCVETSVIVRRHRLDAALEARREHGGIYPPRGNVGGEALEVRLHELAEIHRQQRTVQIEEHCAIGCLLHVVILMYQVAYTFAW